MAPGKIQAIPVLDEASTTTISDVLTAASGVTVSSVSFARWGKMATLRIGCKKSSSISGQDNTIATLKDGYKTSIYVYGNPVLPTGMTTCALTASGNVQVGGTISANTNMYMGFVYILE